MQEDLNVFGQPGFWIALILLALLLVAGVAVIAANTSYPVPS